MKISEIITDKYKLRIPPTVYYELLAAVQEVEEEQEPCEDAISRQAGLEYIEGSWAELGHSSENELVCQDIKKMPPVTPQPKTGHWIVEIWNNREHHTCSECNHVVDYEPCYHYCPFCGARIRII